MVPAARLPKVSAWLFYDDVSECLFSKPTLAEAVSEYLSAGWEGEHDDLFHQSVAFVDDGMIIGTGHYYTTSSIKTEYPIFRFHEVDAIDSIDHIAENYGY